LVIADLPSNTAVAAGSRAAAATGAIATRTVVLMTPEEVDAATELTPNYRPPGG
jgi:microcompartment protein CcmL/EutN